MDKNTDAVPGYFRVPDLPRSELYKNHLCRVYDELSLASHDSRFVTALHDRRLPESFAVLVDQYITSGVAADLRLCRRRLYESKPVFPVDISHFFQGYASGESNMEANEDTHGRAYQNYFDWLIRRSVVQDGREIPGREAFFRRNPRTEQALDTLERHFTKNIIEMIARLNEDWELLERFFFEKRPERLTGIESAGSDFHRGGKQVLILTFRLADGEFRKLVYKPGDIEIDCYLVGMIEGLPQNIRDLLNRGLSKDKQNIGSDTIERTDPDRSEYFLVKRSMSELLNGERGEALFPVYRILPRFPGSLFQDVTINDEEYFPAHRPYGYMEYLTHTPDDFTVTDEKDKTRFYSAWGALTAMARLLSISDLHVQNVIVHKKLPHLLDLEDSFKRPFLSFRQTLIFSDELFPGSMDGLYDTESPGYEIRFDHSGRLTTSPIMMKSGGGMSGRRPVRGKNMLYENNMAVSFVPFFRTILDSFHEVAQSIVCNPEIDIWLDQIQTCTARFVVENTFELIHILTRYFGTEHCGKQAFVYGSEEFKNVDEELKPVRPFGEKDHRKIFLNRTRLYTENNNFRDFINLDVPYYIHRLNGDFLFNSEGQETEFFLPEPSIMAVRQQLKDANVESLAEELVEEHLGIDPEKIKNGFVKLNRSYD